jgi:tRNA (cmo5U34)-methyltransferase
VIDIVAMSNDTGHRVLAHLGLQTNEYDRVIRTFIPGYEEMLATVARWLRGHLPEGGLVVDLGAGTGALSHAILAAVPGARLELVDVDPAMLEAARERLAPHAGRYEIRRAAFADPLRPCDAVVASLALHHVVTLSEKRELYRRIREALRPGGLLLVADAAVHERGRARQRIFAEWSAFMQTQGISAAEAEAHFAQWATEDHYKPLVAELDALAAAGFPYPDCFWKEGPNCVFGGFRDG